jgi:hypothetical protein
MDIVYLALGIGFFLASLWFVRACGSLEPAQEEKK